MSTGYQAKVDQLFKLIDGKAYKLAETYANKEHKSISHYGKADGEFLVNSAKVAIIDYLIARVNKL